MVSVIKKNEKIKSVLLLCGLFLYCGILVSVFTSSEPLEQAYHEPARTEEVQIIQDLEYLPIESVDEIEIRQTELEESAEEGEVLGLFGGTARCDGEFGGIDDPQLFCAAEDVSSSQTHGIDVSADADIRFVEIYAPSALFTGARTPYDNLVQTSNHAERIAFRNANEMVNPEFDYLRKNPPIDEYGESGVDREDGSGQGDQDPFTMHGVPTGSAVGYREPDKVIFDADVEGDKSMCPEVVNDGRFNVSKSNAMGNELVDSVSPPGLMAFQEEDHKRDNEEFCHEVDHDQVIHLTEDESFLLCKMSAWEQAWTVFSNFVSLRDIFNELGDLIGVRKTVHVEGILMDAPFGSADSCNKESCAIRNLEAGRLLTSPPTETESLSPSFLSDEELDDDYIVMDSKFLTTPCKISVDGKIENTKCYWDLSAWQHHLKLEEGFIYPGFVGKLTEEEYWLGVERELKGYGLDFRERERPGGTIAAFDNKDWEDHLLAEIRASDLMNLNPADANEFFPGGEITEEGWLALLTAMSYLESGHRPDLQYEEDPDIWDNTTNAPALSTGLFQMSQGSIRGYNFSGYENVTTEELKDPKTNITIAVQLLETLIKRDNRIAGRHDGEWRGGARYWAVLRDGRGVDVIKDGLK